MDSSKKLTFFFLLIFKILDFFLIHTPLITSDLNNTEISLMYIS
jgi:hypothetical protein